jgi:predicted RNase H-like HicB family nuclease
MVDLDGFSITSSEDVDMCCAVPGCWDWIPVRNGDTLAEVRDKAKQHLAEKHAVVLDGEVVQPRQELTAQ